MNRCVCPPRLPEEAPHLGRGGPVAIIGLVGRAAARRSSSDSGWPGLRGTCGLPPPTPGAPAAKHPGLQQRQKSCPGAQGQTCVPCGLPGPGQSHTEDRQDSWRRGPTFLAQWRKLDVNLNLTLDASIQSLRNLPRTCSVPRGCLHGHCEGHTGPGRLQAEAGPEGRGLLYRCLWAGEGQSAPPHPWHTRTASPGKIKEMGGQQLPLHQERLVCAIWCHRCLASSETVSWRKP